MNKIKIISGELRYVEKDFDGFMKQIKKDGDIIERLHYNTTHAQPNTRIRNVIIHSILIEYYKNPEKKITEFNKKQK